MKPLKDLIKPSRIIPEISQSKIDRDLKIFQRTAIDLGAADAAVVSSDEIIVDERVRVEPDALPHVLLIGLILIT